MSKKENADELIDQAIASTPVSKETSSLSLELRAVKADLELLKLQLLSPNQSASDFLNTQISVLARWGLLEDDGIAAYTTVLDEKDEANLREIQLIYEDFGWFGDLAYKIYELWFRLTNR